MRKHLLLFIGAPVVGTLLLWWAKTYQIEWFSKQMVFLMLIMFFDRLLYYAWRSS